MQLSDYGMSHERGFLSHYEIDKIALPAQFVCMPERCGPSIHFHRVRPYIHGPADNPALGEELTRHGVEKFDGNQQAVRGQTGSQSSIAGNDLDVGTGGTPFMRYLKKHRDENRAQLVG